MKKKLLILALALSSVVWAGDFEDGEAAYNAENYAKAVSKVEKAAEQGSADAQERIGSTYQHGWGVKEDYAEAVRWYTKAAEQGYVVAQVQLGEMYYNGQGVEQNYAEAVRWYTKAAEQGYASAQYSLGNMHQYG